MKHNIYMVLNKLDRGRVPTNPRNVKKGKYLYQNYLLRHIKNDIFLYVTMQTYNTHPIRRS